MAISSITGVTNAKIWDIARKLDPSFASHTAEATAELFTEKGFEQLNRIDPDAINEYFKVSMRVAFQLMNVAGAKNPLADTGLLQVFDTPNGGYTQRMAVNAVKPVSPGYRIGDYNDGESVDPFVIRKPEVTERFFEQNFDFQNLISSQQFNVKTIFINEYGMGQLLAGIMKTLQASYVKQEYYNVLECINAAINSTAHALQDSQVVRLSSWTDGAPTTAELVELITVVRNVIRDIEATASSSKYNAARFDDKVDTSDLVLFVRPEIMTAIEVLNALNAPGVGFPMEAHAIENFGGVYPVARDEDSSVANVRLYPISDALGIVRGYASESYVGCVAEQLGIGSPTVWIWCAVDPANPSRRIPLYMEKTGKRYNEDGTVYQDKTLTWVDPNTSVLGMLAQKGVIFENAQNPYTVEPIRNPRGMYDNYWANRPGTTIAYDSYYDLIVFCKPQ